MSPPTILLINGPNLNLLGTREPAIYGATSLSDVVASCRTLAATHSAKILDYQSNGEGDIVSRIQMAKGEGVSVIVINAGAYTHTSVAIRDALVGVDIPFIEVHVSNVHTREPFRHHSYLSDKAVAVIVGFGVKGYDYAVDFAATSPKFQKNE